MTKYIFSLLLACFSGVTPASAISWYNEGATLYVWAKSGLVMRAAPDFKAEKITSLPFGSAVVTVSGKAVDERSGQVEVAVIEPCTWENRQYPGYKIPGHWAQVNVQGKTGYVFDGYLSHYPPAPKTTGAAAKAVPGEDIDGYLTRVFGTACRVEDNDDDDPEVIESLTVFFKNGASCTTANVGADIEGETRYILPGLSLEEGYLIANYYHGLDKQANRPPAATDDHYCFLEESTSNDLYFNFDLGEIRVSAVNGVVVITVFFSC